MKKSILLLALASLTGMSHADENCVVKSVRLPVIEVNDLHQEMVMPETATMCGNGKCESYVAKTTHFSTEARYQIVLAYKGGTVSYESGEVPQGKTVAVQVRECGRTHKPPRATKSNA
ncbi:hypothetical protein M3795_25085 [Ralstonia pickettii]|uniref:hypothetical protein n=1 Tax=Ralstonia pickettii TaxID=329 RepID=UPI00203DFBDF|nr:hypothetical protein [Ralstonia pickettii]MCM3583748.1 hypothetical protein [Ralstonia pickettii]